MVYLKREPIARAEGAYTCWSAATGTRLRPAWSGLPVTAGDQSVSPTLSRQLRGKLGGLVRGCKGARGASCADASIPSSSIPSYPAAIISS
eukprot:1194991-Prorocentrum_minimum.AAC.4